MKQILSIENDNDKTVRLSSPKSPHSSFPNFTVFILVKSIHYHKSVTQSCHSRLNKIIQFEKKARVRGFQDRVGQVTQNTPFCLESHCHRLPLSSPLGERGKCWWPNLYPKYAIYLVMLKLKNKYNNK